MQILRIIAKNPYITQRDLAAELGISVGGAHYLLNAMIREGLVCLKKARPDSGARYGAYMLTKMGFSEKVITTADFLNRKMAEYKALRHEINALIEELNEQESKEDQCLVDLRKRCP